MGNEVSEMGPHPMGGYDFKNNIDELSNDVRTTSPKPKTKLATNSVKEVTTTSKTSYSPKKLSQSPKIRKARIQTNPRRSPRLAKREFGTDENRIFYKVGKKVLRPSTPLQDISLRQYNAANNNWELKDVADSENIRALWGNRQVEQKCAWYGSEGNRYIQDEEL